MNVKKKERINQTFFNALCVVLCLLILFPFVLVLAVSFSRESDIIAHGYSLIPEHFDLTAYKYVWENPSAVLNAYKTTAIFTALYTFLSVLLMSMLAFMLSKKNFRGKTGIAFFVYFTTLFSAGTAPMYIWLSQYLHLTDSIWVYVLPGLISPWYVFMIRTFFQGVPYSITESAKVDGASEYRILFQIIIPLSKPVIAAVSLIMMLAKWNDWYTSMLYINDERLISIQYLLQRMMSSIQMLQENSDLAMFSDAEIPSETVRMAMVVVVAGPALLIFPYFQKYFVKGLTIGSVKG